MTCILLCFQSGWNIITIPHPFRVIKTRINVVREATREAAELTDQITVDSNPIAAKIKCHRTRTQQHELLGTMLTDPRVECHPFS
jgi:hypothetical protein